MNTNLILFIAFAAMAVLLGLLGVLIEHALRRLRGRIRMARKVRLTKEVLEILEDHFVEGLTEAIQSGRISLDDARITYAKLAHMGFWGLHPRKFCPKKTGLDLTELKERLKAERAAREVNRQPHDLLASVLTALK